MRVVCISDPHGRHDAVDVPEGDILIHAGDLTSSGKHDEVKAAAKWLGSLTHPPKIAIAGNHDLVFESSPSHAIAFLRSAGATYLEDTGIKIAGRLIYGSPCAA